MRNSPLCETAAVITCQQCGKAFSPKTKLNKFCSCNCRWKYYYYANRERILASNKKWRKDRICQHCGKAFSPKKKRSKFCSIKCASRFFYYANREKILAYAKKWRKDHPEIIKDIARRCYEKRKLKRVPMSYTRVCENPNCRKVFVTKFRIKKYCCTRCCHDAAHARLKANPEALQAMRERMRDPIRMRERQALESMRRFEMEQRMASDPEYYAKFRARKREQARRRHDKTRKKPYKALLNHRIPDYLCKGQRVFDSNSPFLFVNSTDSMRAFAKELAIERKEYICDNNLM